jgi:hypothetical protein
MKHGLYQQLCCYAGCTREYYIDLDAPMPSVEELEEALRTGARLPNDGQFTDFCVYECEGRIYCTEDYLCPWHEGDCIGKSKPLLSGSLCSEHFEKFGGQNFGDYFSNIAKADPELFDRSRADHAEEVQR